MFFSEKNNPNKCRNCKLWSGNINITTAVLTGPRQQYNNSDQGPTSVISGMRTVPEMKQSLVTHANWTRWHDIVLDFQVLTSIYCQKQIKVNVKPKRITVQCVWLWYQHLLWRLTINHCVSNLHDFWVDFLVKFRRISWRFDIDKSS